VIPIGEMTRVELAAFINETLLKAGISSVLSGGSCVSVWTNNRFASLDLDFILGGLHWQDAQAFIQAVGVAKDQSIDWEDLKSWHEKEGITDQFHSFKTAVETP
jgi:hypothetical protein